MSNKTTARKTGADISVDALRARGLTQQGRTQDKIAGFDPAAAPMETDQEAGSGAAPRAQLNVADEPARPPETTYAAAMRPPESRRRLDGVKSGWAVALLVAIAGGVVLALIAF